MIRLTEREMTSGEYQRVKLGFDEHSVDHGNPIEASERFSFVAADEGVFVGCSSGLVELNGARCNGWFYLSDLYVEKPYRGRGIGKALLASLESRTRDLGVRRIWTWTAGYGAPDFYRKQGYTVFVEFPDWYATGHSRFGLWKILSARS